MSLALAFQFRSVNLQNVHDICTRWPQCTPKISLHFKLLSGYVESKADLLCYEVSAK